MFSNRTRLRKKTVSVIAALEQLEHVMDASADAVNADVLVEVLNRSPFCPEQDEKLLHGELLLNSM